MSNFVMSLLKASTKAGLDSNKIQQIAKMKYGNVDLRMDPQFAKRDAFHISDDFTNNVKEYMQINETFPTAAKERLEDLVAKAIAMGDDQQILRHTNAMYKFSDDVFGPGGANNVTNIEPAQLARSAANQSLQLEGAPYGNFPGREGIIKANIERMMKEAPGEVELLRRYLRENYEGTYAEFLKNEVDPEKWIYYQNPFPENYRLGGRVGAAKGGFIRYLLKLLGIGGDKGIGSMMQPKTPAGNISMRNLVPDNELDMRVARTSLMDRDPRFREYIMGESQVDNEMFQNMIDLGLPRSVSRMSNPVFARHMREGFARGPVKGEGIMSTSKLDDEIRKMMDDMESMKRQSESYVAEADFAVRGMRQKEMMLDDLVKDLQDGVPPREAIQKFIDAYNKLREPNASGGRVGLKGGGIANLIRRLVGADEESMFPRKPFDTGHKPDVVADLQQMRKMSRSEPGLDLDQYAEIEQMVLDSPRYKGLMQTGMLQEIDYEKFRAHILYDDAKLQKLMEVDPEGTDMYIRMVYRLHGSESGFASGGIVNTLAAPESTVAQRNAMTNEDLYGINQQMSPFQDRISQLASNPFFAEARKQNQEFQLRQNEQMQNYRMQEMQAQQGLADTYAGMDDFQQVGVGLDQKLESLGRGLSQGQGQILQQLRNDNNNGVNPYGNNMFGNQVLGGMSGFGVGNLFGTRR
tara:strand:+ start:2292 stop:4367 length:2076 start_codon:yes stop_codon:yes gene_type:complete